MYITKIKNIIFLIIIASCKKETYVHPELNCSCAEKAEGTYIGNYHAFGTSFISPYTYDTTFVKTYIIINKSTAFRCLLSIDSSTTLYKIDPDGRVDYSTNPIIRDGIMEINHTENYGTGSGGGPTSHSVYHGIKQ